MKNNKEVRKASARVSRTAEAQRQLVLARDLIASRALFAAGETEFRHSAIVCVDLEWYEADQSR